MNARIIAHYLETNEQTNKVPNSLYRILRSCCASKVKVMHGLDNATELGMNVMESLQTVVTRLGEHGLDMKKKTL